MDANAFVLASMLGPLMAAASLTLLGPAAGMVAIGIPFGLAALALRGVQDPETGLDRERPLVASAWEGLRYTFGNPTLRGLAISIASLTFAVASSRSSSRSSSSTGWVGPRSPSVSRSRSRASPGLASVIVFGRRDTRGKRMAPRRHRHALPDPATALLWLAGRDDRRGRAARRLCGGQRLVVLTGLLEGPLDIGMFTMRQRRTDPAWFGRAFAISMAVNGIGFPLGAAVAGSLAEVSIGLAILVGVVAAGLATLFAAVLVPRTDEPGRQAFGSSTTGTEARAG